MDLAFLIIFGSLAPFNVVAAALGFRKWRNGVQGPKAFILQALLAVVCASITVQLADRLLLQSYARTYVETVVNELHYGKLPDLADEMPDEMRQSVEALRNYDFGPNYTIDAHRGYSGRAFAGVTLATGETFLFGLRDTRPGRHLWLTTPDYKVYLMVYQKATEG
ncbi:MAG: hypothetical protein GY851_11875 [bacterium]|nr:hypothetical protein [bacterium]